MSVHIVAIVRALEAIPDLDAASHDDRSACARRILEKAPTVLVADLVDRITYASSRLANLLRTDPNINMARRLAYVGSIAVNGTGLAIAPAAPVDDGDPRRAERIFNQHESGEYNRGKREWEATQQARATRSSMPDYAPPSVVARAFATAIATWPPRPPWGGSTPRPMPPWQPSGAWNEDHDSEDARGRGAAPMGALLDDTAEVYEREGGER